MLAEAVVKLIHALAGYTMLPLPTGASPLGQLPWHIRLTADGVLGVFGANFQGPPTGWAGVSRCCTWWAWRWWPGRCC